MPPGVLAFYLFLFFLFCPRHRRIARHRCRRLLKFVFVIAVFWSFLLVPHDSQRAADDHEAAQ